MDGSQQRAKSLMQHPRQVPRFRQLGPKKNPRLSSDKNTYDGARDSGPRPSASCPYDHVLPMRLEAENGSCEIEKAKLMSDDAAPQETPDAPGFLKFRRMLGNPTNPPVTRHIFKKHMDMRRRVHGRYNAFGLSLEKGTVSWKRSRSHLLIFLLSRTFLVMILRTGRRIRIRSLP